jgi:hypothetical protein
VHQHHNNRVIVYLDVGAEMLTTPEGKTEKMSWRAGEVKWSPSIGPHATANAAGRPFRFIEVDLKKPPSGKPVKWPQRDPLAVDPQHYKLEFDNTQVRVFRAKLGGHDRGRLHEHVVNRVLVPLMDGRLKATAADGTESESLFQAGHARWGTPVTHSDENLTDQPFDLIVIELKP